MQTICSLKDIYIALNQFEKEFSLQHELTINEAMLLCCLKDGQSKSAGEIRDFIGLSNSRISKVITSVETKGLISRSICPLDKRQMDFTLTDEGRAKVQQMCAADLHIDELYERLAMCMKKD